MLFLCAACPRHDGTLRVCELGDEKYAPRTIVIVLYSVVQILLRCVFVRFVGCDDQVKK